MQQLNGSREHSPCLQLASSSPAALFHALSRLSVSLSRWSRPPVATVARRFCGCSRNALTLPVLPDVALKLRPFSLFPPPVASNSIFVRFVELAISSRASPRVV